MSWKTLQVNLSRAEGKASQVITRCGFVMLLETPLTSPHHFTVPKFVLRSLISTNSWLYCVHLSAFSLPWPGLCCLVDLFYFLTQGKTYICCSAIQHYWSSLHFLRSWVVVEAIIMLFRAPKLLWPPLRWHIITFLISQLCLEKSIHLWH